MKAEPALDVSKDVSTWLGLGLKFELLSLALIHKSELYVGQNDERKFGRIFTLASGSNEEQKK